MEATRVRILEQIAGSTRHAIASVRQRSALNPAIGLCIVVTVPSFILAAITPGVRVPFIAIGSLPVAAGVFAYIYLLLRDPDRLQTEDFLTRMSELGYIYRKGDVTALPAADLELKTNPGATGGP